MSGPTRVTAYVVTGRTYARSPYRLTGLCPAGAPHTRQWLCAAGQNLGSVRLPSYDR